MAEDAARESGQQYLGHKEFLSARKPSTVALVRWFTDGTLVSATEDGQGSLNLEEGLARSYQDQFSHSPEFVASISRAFSGYPVNETVSLRGNYWDARLLPAFDSGKLRGVVGILVNASDRITAHRMVSAIEILSDIRHHLARSDSVDEFLHRCCKVIEERHPAVWIGIANRGEEKSLQVVTGIGESSRRFAAMTLSWDIRNKSGRHLAAEAVRSGRVQVSLDVENLRDNDAWPKSAVPWKGALAVPLLANGEMLGVLVVHSDDARDFDSEMIGLWEKIGSEITEGIGLLRAREERARIAAERQGAHQQYQKLLDTIFDVVLFHRDGKIIKVNPAGVKLAGAASAEEMIGNSVLALIDPRDREWMKDTLRDTQPVGELREFRVLSLDGRTVDVEGLTVSSWDEGAPVRLSHWRDISERKRSEQLILKQKTSLEYAQQVAKSGSIELDVATGKAEWSRNALAILEINLQLQDDPFLAAVNSVLGTEDQTELSQLIDNIRKTAKEHSCELRIRPNDGSRPARTIQFHGIPQIEQHVYVPRIFFVVQDITVFREAEGRLSITAEQLRRAQALGRIGHFEILVEDRTVVLSQAAAQLLEFSAGPEFTLTIESLYRQIPRDDETSLRPAMESLLSYAQRLRGGGRQLETAPVCRVDCRLDTIARPRWVHIHAEVTDEGEILGNVQDITERKLVEVALQEAQSKLLATRQLARVAEWTYEIEPGLIVFHGSMRDFLGFESPIKSITLDQYFGSIRPEDREPVRRAVEQTKRHGSDAEVVYEETFHNGVKLLLFTRWVPERDAAGKMIRFRGLSIDITRVRQAHDREVRKQRIHANSGLAEKEMAEERLAYLTTRAVRFGMPFSSIGLSIRNYPDIKRRMADDALYNQTHMSIARTLLEAIPQLDTLARLGHGRFLMILSRAATQSDLDQAAQIMTDGWQKALQQSDSTQLESISTSTAAVHCPQNGTEWEGLLALLEKELEA